MTAGISFTPPQQLLPLLIPAWVVCGFPTHLGGEDIPAQTGYLQVAFFFKLFSNGFAVAGHSS